jgi:hypothetical protein
MDALEAEARRRALEGWEEPVFFGGVVCGHVQKYDSTLLLLLLKAHRPGKFGDHARVEHSGDGTVQVAYPTDWPDSPALAGSRSGRP